MTDTDLPALRAHYDSADTSQELERAQLETSSTSDTMVGITIRLPASTLDAARATAREEGVKVTALLRQWIEQQVADGADADEVISVADLKRLIARSSHNRRAG